MKFKSIFLGMLGMAAIVSCNNESAIDGPASAEDSAVVEGLPVYTTMSIKFGTGVSKASTYAGTEDVTSSANESAIKDAAVYIYKRDNSGTTPQCAVYLSAMGPGNGDNATVTLRTTSGQKKIFVATNVKANPSSGEITKVTGIGAVSTDIAALTPPLTAALLNSTVYSGAASPATFLTTAPATPLWDAAADGLIKTFAMNDIYGTGNGVYTGAGTNAAFMSNWDGAVDAGDGGTATAHQSGADFTLYADVDSVASRPVFPGPTFNTAKNQLNVYVQRAFAKVSLKFGFAAVTQAAPSTPSGLVGKYYVAAVGGNNEGRFFPWGSGSDAVWSLGNIPTAELPIQQYVNGVVQDMNYLNTDDSIHQPTKWHINYDNTRVFPFTSTIQNYPDPVNIKVTNTKSNMIASGNNQKFTADNSTNQGTYNYAYTTENARLDPVCHDHGTYVIVGGFYQPKNVLTSINRANVAGSAPILGYNGAVLTGTELPGTSVGLTSPYTWTATANDTLYYISDDQIFIQGKDNLMAYYAWATSQMKNINAGDNWLAANPGTPITAADVYAFGAGSGADFGSAVATFINGDIDDNVLFAFFEGQCFYRIFIQNDLSASTADRATVLRNHIYDVNITSIKGPGIDDPNKILIPGQPILEQTTYVSTTINVLDWHKVDQDKDVDNQ